MSKKQIHEIKKEDLIEYPIWHFSIDDDEEDDELTVRPFTGGNALIEADRLVIRTVFKDNNGNKYLGYIYWGTPKEIFYLLPTMFVNNTDCITFWNGNCKSLSWDTYKLPQRKIKNYLPIKFESEEHAWLEKINGILGGLYYRNERDDIICVKS